MSGKWVQLKISSRRVAVGGASARDRSSCWCDETTLVSVAGVRTLVRLGSPEHAEAGASGAKFGIDR